MTSAKRLEESRAEIKDAWQEWKAWHPLKGVLFIGFATVLSGGDNFEYMERFGEAKREIFEEYLGLSNGVSSHDTFWSVFEMIRVEELLAVLQRWRKASRCA